MTDQSSASSSLCSFCGKPQDEVGLLVSGPNNVFICDECVVLCLQITSEKDGLNVRAAYYCFEIVAKLLYPIAVLARRKGGRQSN